MRVEMQQHFVMKKITGDTMTPISVYMALNGKNKVLFESNAKFSESGRYSFIAVNPVGELRGDQYQSSFFKNNGGEQVFEQPVLQTLKDLLPIRDSESYPFAFFGGAIGYFGYETAYHFEGIGDIVNDVYEMPDVHVFFTIRLL